MSYIGKNEDDWAAERAKAERKARRKKKTACLQCGKRYVNIDAHLKDAHGLRRVPAPSYTVEPLWLRKTASSAG